MAVSYTFSPPFPPDWGLSREYKPRVLKAAFGDGYSQRMGDGINNNPAAFKPKWTNLSLTELNTILNFFIARKGYQSFYYTYIDDSAAKVYVCEDWSYSHDDAGAYSINATFTQVYDF